MNTLPTADLAHTLIALAAILMCAHGMGSLFVRFRQPRAIGEVLGGLLLGATVLGWLSQSTQAWIFPTSGSTPVILGAVYQLGLLLLLFIAGSELRTVFHRGERRTVAAVFVAGTTIPFVAGLGISQMIDQESLWGPNGNTTSFVLVFSIALAITSIPVISRIMHMTWASSTPRSPEWCLESRCSRISSSTSCWRRRLALQGRPAPHSSACRPRSGSRLAHKPISPTT
jgi:Kef-type K+ transport system membrane component KefB